MISFDPRLQKSQSQKNIYEWDSEYIIDCKIGGDSFETDAQIYTFESPLAVHLEDHLRVLIS